MNIGYFVSSHGFGHAARACAVIEKIPRDSNIFIFSSTPDWFFRNSLEVEYQLIQVKTDIGLVQDSPFTENLENTIKELDEFYPFKKETIDSITELVNKLEIHLIFCDISPLGIEIANRTGIPSILIENFTWDWIYEQYLPIFPEFERFINMVKKINSKVSLRFSVEPFCQEVNGAIKTPSLFREPKNNRETIRDHLGIKKNEKLILITMGGIPVDQIENDFFTNRENYKFLFPINGISEQYQQGNAIYLPHNHKYFHPDLVNASDLVVGKLGYSTIAEVYSRQKPFLYIKRDSFRESKVLEDFVNRNLVSDAIEYNEIYSDEVIRKISPLLKDHNKGSVTINGSDVIIGKLKELNFPLY